MKDMPSVARCEVDKCFFNRDQACHAPAINVGGDHPECDTFVAEQRHIDRTEGSVVGACHVRDCRWNKEMLCHAASISVSAHLDHADCSTFTKA